MKIEKIAQIIEGLLYISGDPLLLKDIQKALDISKETLQETISYMEKQYEAENRGICLRQFGEHLRLETHSDCAPYIEKLLQPVQKQTLSQTIMETLAVIAYHQPTTKADIESFRGVKCDYSVQALLQKGLIVEVGRKESLGKPILYGTTDAFLVHFGISDLRELPPFPAPAPLTETPTLVP